MGDAKCELDPARVGKIKRRYESEGEALTYASRIKKKKRKQKGGRLYPYQCPWCGHWHLTRRTPDEQY